MTSTLLGLLLALALLSNACAPLTPPPGRGTHLRYTPREAAAPTWSGGPGAQSEPEEPQRLHRRQDAREHRWQGRWPLRAPCRVRPAPVAVD
jgi:hypothetical protein